LAFVMVVLELVVGGPVGFVIGIAAGDLERVVLEILVGG